MQIVKYLCTYSVEANLSSQADLADMGRHAYSFISIYLLAGSEPASSLILDVVEIKNKVNNQKKVYVTV